MATTHQVTMAEIAERLVSTISTELSVQGVWIEPVGDRLDFWVITDDIDSDTELRIYRHHADLYNWFPELLMHFHVIFSEMFEPGTRLIERVVPRSARRVYARA